MRENTNGEAFNIFKINCSQCCGLCCTALYFTKAEGFPENKKAGVPCKNLLSDYTCGIHSGLSQKGLKGCAAYDCFGAGQRVTNQLEQRPDWNNIKQRDGDFIFQSYSTVMQLHQVLWYLTQASLINTEAYIKSQISSLLTEGRELAELPLEILQEPHIISFRERSNQLLKEITRIKALSYHPKGHKPRSGDYIGKNLNGKDLSGRDLSMSLFIAASLEKAVLKDTNFLGADLRDANIKNTDLSQSLFLTQIQINGARGNKNTILPPYLEGPGSWMND